MIRLLNPLAGFIESNLIGNYITRSGEIVNLLADWSPF